MVRIPGQRVTLRPMRPDELGLLVDGYRRTESVGGRPPSRDAIRRRVQRSGRLVRGRLELAVEVEGRLVGEVDARSPASAFPPGVYEIGITLFDPGDRSKGYGLEATRLLVDHLFDAEEAARVQATTDRGNEPMRSLLERLDFRYEGTLRGFFPTAAGRADYAMYALTRADWLEPDRHDDL